MKKSFSIAIFSLFAVALSSCSKTVDVADTSAKQPNVIAKIYPNVNQPSAATLGNASANFAYGDKVVVYVPYEIDNDDISMADLVISDDQGQEIMTTNLMISTDPASDGLNVPQELQGTPFMYGTIDINDSFANKTLVLSISIRGTNGGYSADTISNCFTVHP